MSYYDEYESEDCFDPPVYMVFNMDDLEIGFSEEGIYFYADWDIANACRGFEDQGSSISFSFKEIEPFMKN